MPARTCHRRWHWFTVALIVTGYCTAASGDNIRIERLGIEDGLAQNTITAIVQDHSGFLWLGTQDGLHRYDGHEFKVYKADSEVPGSISNPTVRCLFIDARGALWVGTYLGLSKYEAAFDRFVNYRHDPDDPLGLSASDVRSVWEDRNGTLWIGTDGGGLNRLDREQQTFEHYRKQQGEAQGLSSDTVLVIYEDSAGHLWIGTNEGINTVDPNTGLITRFDINDELSEATVTAIHEDKEQRLWIGTEATGLYVLDASREKVARFMHDPNDHRSLSDNNVTSILEDSSGGFWVGTYGGGLNRFEPEQHGFAHYGHDAYGQASLSDDRIQSIYEDRSGALWIGTYSGGANKLNPYGFSLTLTRYHPSPDSPEVHNDARAFLIDQRGALWVGSESGGIRVTERDGALRDYRNNPTDPASLSRDEVFSIIEDRQGTVWVGTENGWLNRYDRESDSFVRYQPDSGGPGSIRHGKVRSIMEGRRGLLWVGMDTGGLHSFDPKRGRFKHYHNDPGDPASLSHNRVFSVCEDRAGIIWVATFGGGLNGFDPESRTFHRYTHDPANDNSLVKDHILSILQDRDQDILWLGTLGGGIERFDPISETFTHYGEAQGLPNDIIYGIVQDDNGHLWASHNKGLSRFDPQSKTFKNYDAGDGLQSNEFNGGSYYRSAEGKLFFGGINGYNAFFPDAIIDNPHPPAVAITNFTLFNQPVGIGEVYDGRILLENAITQTKALTLFHRDSVFSFEFAALDFVHPAKNQYAYRMDGLEQDWNYVGNRNFVTYTTLPPGEYVFRVKASNSHGVWNEEGASVAITVAPPYWQTWWFRLACVGLLLLIGSLIYGWRVKSIRTRNRILEREVKIRTAQLEEQKASLENTLVELGETKNALIRSAHKAGMADTATGVLHNIGNILNSVGTSAGLMYESLSRPVLTRFAKATALLQDNLSDLEQFLSLPKGKKLIQYLVELEQPFQRENSELKRDAHRVLEKITAIKDVIAAQQDRAKGQAQVEVIPLQDLVEECLIFEVGSLERHRIQVQRNFQPTPAIALQKTKVIQILMNLIQNAKDSINEANPDVRKLRVDIYSDSGSACIRLVDNGVGIASEDLDRIFGFGYTTKIHGHGFGLHSVANYMSEMGGEISAESSGKGQGASFLLRFPISEAREQEEPRRNPDPVALAS